MASKSEKWILKRTLAGLSIAAIAGLAWDATSAQLINSNRISGVPIRQIQPMQNYAPTAAEAYRTPYSGSQNYGAQNYGAQNYDTASLQGYSNAITEAAQPAAYNQSTVQVLSPADTSRQAQQNALASIPWDELNPEGTRKLKEIVDNASIYRRLPISKISCDPQFYTFSIRNPETIVNMWQVFGVTTMGLNRTGPYTFAGNDGAGTDCTAELIYGDASRHIYVGTGTYEGPVFRRKITGRCVAILKTDASAGANQYDLTNQLDVFIKVDNLAADLIAKTLNPLVGRTADHNFRESLNFLQAFSDSAAQDPNRVNYLAQKLNVEANTRTQFQQIVTGIQPRQQQYVQQRSMPAQAQLSSEVSPR